MSKQMAAFALRSSNFFIHPSGFFSSFILRQSPYSDEIRLQPTSVMNFWITLLDFKHTVCIFSHQVTAKNNKEFPFHGKNELVNYFRSPPFFCDVACLFLLLQFYFHEVCFLKFLSNNKKFKQNATEENNKMDSLPTPDI